MSGGGLGLFFHFPLPNKTPVHLILYRKKKGIHFLSLKKGSRLKICIRNSSLKQSLWLLCINHKIINLPSPREAQGIGNNSKFWEEQPMQSQFNFLLWWSDRLWTTAGLSAPTWCTQRASKPNLGSSQRAEAPHPEWDGQCPHCLGVGRGLQIITILKGWIVGPWPLCKEQHTTVLGDTK